MFSFDQRQIFASQIFIHRGKFLRDFGKSGKIVGSFTPNSAAAERVFSMLKQMFGDMQMSSLADMIQAALMLKYNGRKVG